MASMRQNDRLPAMTAVAYTATAKVDFTAFASIVFRMVKSDGTVKVNNAAATGDAQGNLTYSWGASDTDTAGDYSCVFIATDGSGRKQTFPTGTNLSLTIVPAI